MTCTHVGRTFVFAASFIFATAITAQGAKNSESLLPASTTGWLSVGDVERLRADFLTTQLGELVQDPAMKPFIEQLTAQIQASNSKRFERLGITLEDLSGIPSGEVATAVVAPTPTSAATVLIVDVTGREEGAQAVLTKVSANLTRQGGKRLRRTAGDVVSVFELPKREGDKAARLAISFLKDGLLVLGDDLRVVEDILKAASTDRKDSLASVAGFLACQERCRAGEMEKAPHARWYIEPFGYVASMRIINPPKQPKEMDLYKALRNSGFTAVRALGGTVTFADGEYQMRHRTFIYAPQAPQTAASNAERFTLSARMLDFPNGKDLAPQRWVPPHLAVYSTWNWNTHKAFAASEKLVDELAGDPGVFRDLLDSIRDAKNGPQVDIEKEIVAHLGQRMTVLSDYQTPVGPRSERVLVAIEAGDEQQLALGIEKAMKNDKDVRRREFEGHVIWESVTHATELAEPDLQIEIEGGEVQHADLEVEEEEPIAFQPGKSRTPKGRKGKTGNRQTQRVLPASAFCVAFGHLFVGSHADILEKTLRFAAENREAAEPKGLSTAADYQAVQAVLDTLAASESSFRFFSRTDEEFRVTYELVKTGEMPKAESLFGKILNELLGDGKPGAVRKPRIDGTSLPAFDSVRRYFGPSGAVVTTEKDGWFATGVTLRKTSVGE